MSRSCVSVTFIRPLHTQLTKTTFRVRRLIFPGLSIFLMLTLLVSTTPAAPRLIVDQVTESRTSFAFWWARSDIARLLNPQNWRSKKQQENQEERDARVVRLQIVPGDVTVNISEQVSFSAVALDADNAPVTGVKIAFRGSDPTHGKPVRVTSQGLFKALTPGAYKIVAEGAGKTAEVKVIVKPGSRRDLKEKPISVKQVSSRDVPDAAPENGVAVKTEKSDRSARSGNRRTRALRAHAGTATAAPEPAPFLPSGVGWDNSNYWYADDPDNRRGNAPGAPADAGAGEGNFQISAPLLNLSGRGIDISLALTYNSRLWSKAGSQIGYNNDVDWPAPGWSMGFGRMVGMGTNGGTMLIEADGTRRSYAGTITNYSWGQYFQGHTTDGSFIDYTSFTNVNGLVTSANATLPDGTQIEYFAYDLSSGTAYPTLITDRNGNYITISYVNNNGPRIQTVVDTLGRALNFHYDGTGLLTAITTPGLGGGTRTVVRLLYRQLSLSYGFSGLTTRTPTNFPWVLNAIYYPGTNTGYWFGDADSYSSYGMIAKVVEARGLVFSASSLTVQGTLTPPSASQITRKEEYNYPLTPNFSLTDAPTYTTMTETWTRDGSTNDTATTQFLVTKNATNPSQPSVPSRKVEITLPNGTKNIQYSHNVPGNFKDGLIYQDETRNSGGTLLQGSTTNWELGHYSSARPTRIEITNERSQTTATEFGYFGLYNQVWETRNYDYTGAQLRVTRTEYDNSSNYTNRHIFNLPTLEDVFAGDGTTRVSRTIYTYDGDTLTSRPGGVAYHHSSYDPYTTEEICCDCCNWQWDHTFDTWECVEWCPGVPVFDPATNYRGNLTQKTVYANAAVPAEAISENYRYDITGNRVLTSLSSRQTTFEYTSSTSFTYPLSQTDGSPSNALHQVKTSQTYDVNTGLVLSSTDANGRTTQTTYDPQTLRPLVEATATGAHIDYSYDDANLNRSQTIYLQTHPTHTTIAEQNVTLVNGRGQVRQEKALGAGGVWDLVDTAYDSMGRMSQQSLPYRAGDTIRWNTYTYDGLGRIITTEMPDTSTVQSFYNEVARPAGASSLAGETVRMVDAWGRERWSRSDALGRVVEVVEPDPNGNGSVASNGLLTTYGYNTMGDLTSVTQGSQTRAFQYDSFGRLRAQRLAEATATLNDAGTYVGSGSWTDVFTYDDFSNVISRTDSRGVKILYNYNSDPLNRLQSTTYDTSGFGDTNNPILAAPSITYQYRTKSSGSDLIDITQLSGITTASTSTEAHTFDTEGRVQTSTLTLSSRLSYPFAKQYTYDTLDRITDILYPAEYGNGSAPRRTVQQNYDVASRLTSLTVDGQSHASDFVYNAAGNATSIKVGVSGTNQVTESYSFHAQTGLIENQTLTRNGSTLLNLTYNYANANGKRTGQVVSITNHLNNDKNRGYEYDALGRLKRATSGQNVNWAQRYAYDRYGNRTEVFSYNADQYIRNFYQWGLNRQPNGTELSSWLSTLQTAYTQGQTQFLTAMQSLGTAIFTSQEYINRGRTDTQYVNDLYKAYLVRDGEQSGVDFWVPIVASHGREHVRNGFAWSGEFNQKAAGTSPYMPTGSPVVPRDGWEVVKYDIASNRINLSGWNYDAAGNQTRVQNAAGVWQRFQYDAANRLVRVKADDNTTVLASFTYGCDNQRLIAEEGGQRTYFAPSGGGIAAEYTETGSSVTPLFSKSYVYLGARLLSTLSPTGSGGAAIEYHHPDRLGTRVVTNAQNTSYFEQVVLPFGTALPHESTGATNRRFTTYERSPVVAMNHLDYAVNRTYDNQQGRFTQVDPIGFEAVDPLDPQTLNMYAYCVNDPINAVDPDGLFFKKLFKAIWKVLTNKWFIIAATVALTVITVGSSLGFWALKAANSSTILGTKVTSAVLFGTHTTTLGWIAAGLSTALAIPALASWKATFQRAAVFGLSLAIGAFGNLGGLGAGIGPGGTPDWNPEINGFRRPVQQRQQPRRGMIPWRLSPRNRRPSPNRKPPVFDTLKDHAKRHSQLPPWEYYREAKMHMDIHQYKFNFYHNNQFKTAFVTKIGPDVYLFTSTTPNRTRIFTHYAMSEQGLNNLGITLPKK